MNSAQDVRLPRGVHVRVPPDKRSNKISKKSAVSKRPKIAACSNHHAAIEAELEKNPFHRHNTAGGRIPPTCPSMQISPNQCANEAPLWTSWLKSLRFHQRQFRFWQVSHQDFFEACQVTPGCVERVKRNIYDIAMGQKVVTERIANSASGRQITKVTTNLPANLAASKSFVPETVVQVEGELSVLLRQLSQKRSMVGIRYTGPDGR